MTGVSDIQANFKEAYADKEISLLPESSVIIKSAKFVPQAQMSGNYYHQPVIVQGEQGVTYASPTDDLATLNSTSSMKMQDAQILGSQIFVKGALSNNVIARAKHNSFEEATSLIVMSALETHSKRVELAHLYGQTDVGTVDSSTNASATSTVLTFTTASWSDATWSGMTNATISLFKTTNGDLLNTNAALVITAVSTSAKTLTVSGAAADITAVDAWVGGAGGQQAAVNFYGARLTGNVYVEAAGLDKIITNTGILFNINATTYDLWKGNSYSAGSAALTSGKLDAAIAIAVGRGLFEDVDVLVNPKTWANLNTDQAAKRVYDKSYSDSEFRNGAKKLTFASQNGLLNVVAHPFVKEGDAFVVPFDQCVRVGAKEVSFDTLGGQADMFLTQMENSTGYYFRTYSNQALLCNKPATTVKITAIVNS